MGSASRRDDTVLLLEADQLHRDALTAVLARVIPRAIVLHASGIREGAGVLARQSCDLLVTGGAFSDGDVIDLLHACRGHGQRRLRVLAILAHPDLRTLLNFYALAIEGLFDSVHEGVAELETALRAVTSGGTYYSKSIHRHPRAAAESPARMAHQLTPLEQVVLSVLGDGSDDGAAAGRLGLKPSTVLSIRRELHRKLGVHQKGELVRLAMQHGFVRLVAGRIVKPAFTLSLARCHGRKLKPVATECPRALCPICRTRWCDETEAVSGSPDHSVSPG